MDNIQIELTKSYLRKKGHGFRGVGEYTLTSRKKVEYIKFKDDNQGEAESFPAIQWFPLKIYPTIIINEKIFSEYTENSQDIIVAHEYGHIRFPVRVYLIFRVVKGISLTIDLIALGFLLCFFLLSTFNAQYVRYGLLMILFFIIFLSINWLFETDADFYAINEYGLKEFTSARKECRLKKGEESITDKIQYRLTHPYDILVIRAYCSKLSKPIISIFRFLESKDNSSQSHS